MEQQKCQNCMTLNDKYAIKCQSCGMPMTTHKKVTEKKKLEMDTKILLIVITPFFISLIGILGVFKYIPVELTIFFITIFNILIIYGLTMSIMRKHARNLFISLIAFAWIITINIGIYYQLF